MAMKLRKKIKALTYNDKGGYFIEKEWYWKLKIILAYISAILTPIVLLKCVFIQVGKFV